ncbi:hypothetical protein H4Q26_015714 [Puccinia striiformis f. sp. tritici PST-130]|nr:hypothetical protein H4Q26_015714 [Puccinia striiformis f. sp. tritici PST-130]
MAKPRSPSAGLPTKRENATDSSLMSSSGAPQVKKSKWDDMDDDPTPTGQKTTTSSRPPAFTQGSSDGCERVSIGLTS